MNYMRINTIHKYTENNLKYFIIVYVYEGISMVIVHKLKVEWGTGNGAEVDVPRFEKHCLEKDVGRKKISQHQQKGLLL